MKSVFDKIWNVILIVLFVIIILPFGIIAMVVIIPIHFLWELICTPRHIKKYKQSAYYRDLGLKYTFACHTNWDYKLYNQIKAANLPIDFLPLNTNKSNRHFGYLTYGDTLIDIHVATDAYYDEDSQQWLCTNRDDEESDVETLHGEILQTVTENTGITKVTKVVSLMNRHEMSTEELELAEASPLFLLYDDESIIEALKAFIEQEAQS